MPWYLILTIVIASLIVFNGILFFVIYITNADLHLVEKIYNWLIKYQDKREVKTKL